MGKKSHFFFPNAKTKASPQSEEEKPSNKINLKAGKH